MLTQTWMLQSSSFPKPLLFWGGHTCWWSLNRLHVISGAWLLLTILIPVEAVKVHLAFFFMTVHVDSLQQYCWWVHDVDSYWQQPSKQAVMLLSVHCIQSTHFMAPIQRCLSEQDSRHILQLQTLFVQLTFLWKHEWVQCTALASRHGVINGFVDSSECSPNTHKFLQGHRWPHLIYSTCSLMKCMHLCAFSSKLKLGWSSVYSSRVLTAQQEIYWAICGLRYWLFVFFSHGYLK